MKRAINHMLPYIGVIVTMLGILICLGNAGISDTGGELAVMNYVKGLMVVIIGLVLNRWHI